MRLICLLVSSLLLPLTAQANDLLRIYDEAVKNDAQLQAAEHQRDATMENVPIQRAGYLPQINGAYSVGRTTQETTYDTPTPITPNGTKSFISRGFTVSLSQALFNWQTIQLWRQANSQSALAELTYRGQQQNLVSRVATAYFNVLAANDALRSSQAENKALEQQLEQAKRRFDVGLSAITDVQDAQARYDVTSATIIASQQALDSAREALGEITGTPQEAMGLLQEDIPLPAPDPADMNAWVSAARDSNFNLLTARYNAEIADRGVEVARARHYPTLNLVGSYQDGDQGGLFGANQKTRNIALQVQVPIFSGFATQAGVNQAEDLHLQSQSLLELAKRQVEHTTRDAYQAVIAGAARVKAFKQAVLSNTTAVDASKTGLEVGTRTQVDVLTAEQLLYSAQRDYFRSRYDYLIAVLNLKAAAGRLGAADLAEVDKLLVTP